MKLAISNIGWDTDKDVYFYLKMRELDFKGLEIAPTRIFPKKPYECCKQAKKYAQNLKVNYGMTICSMQSIWYGKTQLIAGTPEERLQLLEYTYNAIMFAQSVGCKNLVFGCPRNRCVSNSKDNEIIEDFFKKIALFAADKNVIIAMEANPVIYNTNYINTTAQAIDLVRRVNCDAFLLNVDFGTIIENKESLDVLLSNADIINHVHISEPGLEALRSRQEHKQLRKILEQVGYDKYVSIEMGKQSNCKVIEKSMIYIKEVFG